MTLQKMAASAGLAVGLATASWGIAATTGTAAASVSSRAANASLAASRAARPVSAQDRKFMDEASQINLTEISLGRYMQAHATNSAAKSLGTRYAIDHTTAQANLRALASRLHVAIATTPGAQNDSVVAHIKGLTGRDMDVAFVATSVAGHKAAIAVFRKEESAGSNPRVRAYAADYLPMLRTHLRMAGHAAHALHVMATK
jgi:putative membrane protein